MFSRSRSDWDTVGPWSHGPSAHYDVLEKNGALTTELNIDIKFRENGLLKFQFDWENMENGP